MSSFLLSALAGFGVYLLLTGRRQAPETKRSLLVSVRGRSLRIMNEAGLEDLSPSQFVLSSGIVGVTATVGGSMIFGFGISSLLLGAMAASAPAVAWRNKRIQRRNVARSAWPRMIEELRVLAGAAGRPVPQALIEVGLRGPEELRPAFIAAQREWALTTDFPKTVATLKEKLADPTADVVLETLLVAVEVGGDLDARMAALAEDRRQDEIDRRDAAAKQSGAKLARYFVIVVPGGMAFAGLNVGDGAAAYRTATGQMLVSAGVALVAACWIWASQIMKLPDPIRVFDK